MSGTLPGPNEPPELLDPTSQPKFVNSLPVPSTIDATKGGGYVIQIREFDQWLGLVDAEGEHLDTTVWGYGLVGTAPSYPGPTFVAMEGKPITVNWRNDLPVDGHLLPVDTTIDMATPIRKTLDEGYVPVVTHLHGGHSASTSDGLPEAWFTQHNAERGPDWHSAAFRYENDQESATLWYHDHALGITRLNVYAGLAGFYLLRDENETALVSAGTLPDRAHEFGMAIQDRAFTADGQLYRPSHPGDPVPGTDETVPAFPDGHGGVIDPTIMPEFFGDFMLVNGMTWPKLDVQPTTYRFHLLNGSDSRFDVLELDNPWVKVTIVGGDGGLLGNAITVMDGDGQQEGGERIVIAPGDRVDAVFDFSSPMLQAGDEVTLLNSGPAFDPFKGFVSNGELAGGIDSARETEELRETVGQIMQFAIGRSAGAPAKATVADGTLLNPDYQPLGTPDLVRKLGLFEGEDDFGRVLPLLGLAEDRGTDQFGPRGFHDPVTERVQLGATEVWEIHNFTEDAHPIHLHLVQFQVLGRYTSGDLVEQGDGDAAPDDVELGAPLDVNPWQSGVQNLYPEDNGWQDTVWVGPGEAIRIAAHFDRSGEYVWHCHILSHEDNEMMRPYVVSDEVL